MVHALRHIHRHLKDHHKKYLFGIFGGYAVVKLFLLVFGLSVVQYAYHTTFAQLATGCMLTGQYYTGEYQTGWYLTWQELTGWYLTWQELTGWYLTWCVTLTWYRTGGSLDESGVLIWQVWIEELSETWCILTWQVLTGWYLTWQELTGWYLTWYYLMGWYRTWWYITWCLGESSSNQTWNLMLSWNGICDSWDIIWNNPISWSILKNIFRVSWAYSWNDCRSWLSLQLWDHNNQRISLQSNIFWITWYLFDSLKLASFQEPWFYHVFWTGTTGQYYLYTWIATWSYLSFYSWYKLRLLAADQTPIYESQAFTINNQNPLLTWITLLSNWLTTWYTNVSGVVILKFISDQPLSGVIATLGSGKIPTTTSVSWLQYTFSWIVSSLYPEGPLSAYIAYLDHQSVISYFVYTWSLIFDKTLPVISWFVFIPVSGWISMIFTWSEPIRYTINYWKTTSWSSMTFSWYTPAYLTSQQFIFSWLELDQAYFFTMNMYDGAGNARFVTGDVLQTALWNILSHTYFVPISVSSQTILLSWSIWALSAALRTEIEKFNTCKSALTFTPISLDIRNNVFTIQMPQFQKTQMKTLVNAFALFVIDKIKHNYSMSSWNITEITKKFDNFLIILKLLRDNDNVCKQNLSNYHISQFQKALQEYNITL